jgi:hypothetical protein
LFAGDDFAAGLADEAPGDGVFAGAEFGLAIGADFAAGAAVAGDAEDEAGDVAGAIPESLAAAFLLLLLEAGAEVGLVELVVFPVAAGAFEVDPDAAAADAVESPLVAADFLLFLLLVLVDDEPDEVPVALASLVAGAAALSVAAGALESVAAFLVLVLLLLDLSGVVESVFAAD